MSELTVKIIYTAADTVFGIESIKQPDEQDWTILEQKTLILAAEPSRKLRSQRIIAPSCDSAEAAFGGGGFLG